MENIEDVPSRELTYPSNKAYVLEAYFPFPQVGHVNSLEGSSTLEFSSHVCLPVICSF